ncbi:MAG: MATE family efflux transporter [Clostridium celatum]|nr:MATE family efflux transporter [Clostridium celatum]
MSKEDINESRTFWYNLAKKMFIKLAISSLVSMLFSSIYMMADGMFVGKVIGSKALAAINLVFPIIMIVFAVGDMIAAGASVKIGIKLGEKMKNRQVISFQLLFY